MANEIELKCFNCGKTFPEDKVEQRNIPSNFRAINTASEQTNTVDQCPYCKAVAFFGFNKVKIT